MIAEYLPEYHQMAMLISLKNGAWFERAQERGFTHLAEYCLQTTIIDRCADAGVDMTLFDVAGETIADRVRLAIFFASADAERVMTVLRECIERPTFTAQRIRREMQKLRVDMLRSFTDGYFRAQCRVTALLTDKNPSVFGGMAFHFFAKGPSSEQLGAYWDNFWHASARDVLVFGQGAEQCRNAAQSLSRDAVLQETSFEICERRPLASSSMHGMCWRESHAHQLYSVLDTVMTLRADTAAHGTKLLKIDRGTWRGYAVLKPLRALRQTWSHVFAKDVSREEWQNAKNAYVSFVDNVRTGENLKENIFYWDDCTADAYGSFGISSLHDLAAFIKESSFEAFQEYWSMTVKSA